PGRCNGAGADYNAREDASTRLAPTPEVPPMSRLTRRRFLEGTLAAAATVTVAGTKSSARVLGSNDRVRVAVAGVPGRGKDLVDECGGEADVDIARLSAPDPRSFAPVVKQAEGKGGKTPRRVQDVRRALEDKNVDAVSVATPNHWHALM